jgi:hypothetical protein
MTKEPPNLGPHMYEDAREAGIPANGSDTAAIESITRPSSRHD